MRLNPFVLWSEHIRTKKAITNGFGTVGKDVRKLMDRVTKLEQEAQASARLSEMTNDRITQLAQDLERRP